MNALQQQQARWDAEALPEPAPEQLALQLPGGWLYALPIGFTALYLGEILLAAWVRT